MDIKFFMGIVANGVFNGFSQVDRIVGPLHTLVIFIDIHCFSHEKAPHSIVIMVQFFSVAHELMVQAPGSFFKTLVLILHTEFTFVSREVWDISHGFASTRHVMMRCMLQGYIDVTKVSDVCVCLVLVCVCIALYWPCAGLHGGNNAKEVPGRGFHQCNHCGSSGGLFVGVKVGLRVGFSLFYQVAGSSSSSSIMSMLSCAAVPGFTGALVM